MHWVYNDYYHTIIKFSASINQTQAASQFYTFLQYSQVTGVFYNSLKHGFH